MSHFSLIMLHNGSRVSDVACVAPAARQYRLHAVSTSPFFSLVSICFHLVSFVEHLLIMLTIDICFIFGYDIHLLFGLYYSHQLTVAMYPKPFQKMVIFQSQFRDLIRFLIKNDWQHLGKFPSSNA